MIDESIGKILGMAMAYGASALGMFVAYVNYRRRVIKADKVMTPAAWLVIANSDLAEAGAVVVVGQQATAPPAEAETVAAPEEEAPIARAEPPAPAPPGERSNWPWVGIVIPAGIFLLATVITAALHRHFTAHGHCGSAPTRRARANSSPRSSAPSG